MTTSGGNKVPGKPYRWGCSCGAIWNTEKDEKPKGALCGPFCSPKIFKLKDSA